MENQNPSLKQIAINYGLLLALVSILLMVVMYVANIEKSWMISIVSMALTIFLLFSAIKAYRHGNGGFLKLGEGLKVGLATAAIAGVVAGLYAYLHYSFVYPEYIDIILEEAREGMASQSQGMTDEQVEQALQFTEMFTTPFMMATFSLIGSLFFGFIISLFSGLILKRDNPNEM
jgi:hypothetical protein